MRASGASSAGSRSASSAARSSASRAPGSDARSTSRVVLTTDHASGPSRAAVREATLVDVGGEHDVVDERADLRDVDLDPVPREQVHLVGRDEAGPGEEYRPGRDRVVADEP